MEKEAILAVAIVGIGGLALYYIVTNAASVGSAVGNGVVNAVEGVVGGATTAVTTATAPISNGIADFFNNAINPYTPVVTPITPNSPNTQLPSLTDDSITGDW